MVVAFLTPTAISRELQGMFENHRPTVMKNSVRRLAPVASDGQRAKGGYHETNRFRRLRTVDRMLHFQQVRLSIAALQPVSFLSPPLCQGFVSCHSQLGRLVLLAWIVPFVSLAGPKVLRMPGRGPTGFPQLTGLFGTSLTLYRYAYERGPCASLQSGSNLAVPFLGPLLCL